MEVELIGEPKMQPKSSLRPAYTLQTQSYKVYLDCQPSPIWITLQASDPSVQDIIRMSILEFSNKYGVPLTLSVDRYQLFIARKNGTRDEDLPSLEFQQPIQQFRHRRFFLAPSDPLASIEKKSTDTSAGMQTSMQIRSKGAEKASKKIPWGCFCI